MTFSLPPTTLSLSLSRRRGSRRFNARPTGHDRSQSPISSSAAGRSEIVGLCGEGRERGKSNTVPWLLNPALSDVSDRGGVSS